jgi:hypothetical protein
VRWSCERGYQIDEIITAVGGRHVRVLRVRRGGERIGDFLTWADVLAELDLGFVIQDDASWGPPGGSPEAVEHDGPVRHHRRGLRTGSSPADGRRGQRHRGRPASSFGRTAGRR